MNAENCNDMNDDRYILNLSGTSVAKADIPAELARILNSFGLVTVEQLYSVMTVSPTAISELVKDFGLTYDELTKLVERVLPADVMASIRESATSAPEYATGYRKSPTTGPSVIRRKEA